MLKMTMLLSLTFIFSTVFSQTKNDYEIIAEGGSKIKVRPDLAIFTLTVEKRDTVEKNAIKLLNLEIDELVKSLYKIGFTNKIIKISDYDISSSQNDDEKKRYTASNVLKLEFGLETKLIDALYKEIQEAGLKDLDISFDTKVSDSLEKITRLKLVQEAIVDAKTNAVNIAKALDIKFIRVKQVLKYKDGILGPPQDIHQVKFTPPKIVGDTQISYNTPFDKFEVEDVELEEKITIVYEISK
ncbi:SIMPL domain-containing protein [Flavihumibacter profundi]|uniref:SIMPL domain-containing protein n=1 Tax=Flavihumibacter profundi TaxID=2716883 RepID=UPI001CC71BB6|nr:SIMPL domain-containing protein [Flavihumibacter profundi]MBZ5857747.1 SIMPL domain-containing protein [Flavihumibacter profundi]